MCNIHWSQCEKTIISLLQKIFRRISVLWTFVINLLVSRNFCQKGVRINFCNFHTVLFNDNLPVSNIFDVLGHQITIHANQSTRQSISKELNFNFHSFTDNFQNLFSCQLILQVRVHQASKISMKTFISWNQFIAKCQTWKMKPISRWNSTLVIWEVWPRFMKLKYIVQF